LDARQHDALRPDGGDDLFDGELLAQQVGDGAHELAAVHLAVVHDADGRTIEPQWTLGGLRQSDHVARNRHERSERHVALP
jgi:hypothetical protein